MPEFYYSKYCPICGPEGELVIARTEGGQLAMVCAECGIGFFSERDVQDAERAVDMLSHQLTSPREDEIDTAGWRHLCRHRVTAELPHR
jgi:uncharacterized Zn finger protein